jgi:hypothetical protein
MLTIFYAGDHIKNDWIDGACGTVGYRRCVHRFLLGKPEENRPLGGPRCRREDNIKWIFKK